MSCQCDILLDMSDSAGYRPDTTAGTVSHTVDRPESAEQLIATIYQAVGDSLGLDADVDPIPIRDTVDPEALAALFNEDTGDAYVSFPLGGRRVTVHSDGEVSVHQFDA